MQNVVPPRIIGLITVIYRRVTHLKTQVLAVASSEITPVRQTLLSVGNGRGGNLHGDRRLARHELEVDVMHDVEVLTTAYQCDNTRVTHSVTVTVTGSVRA
jgi:hypothetical protein